MQTATATPTSTSETQARTRNRAWSQALYVLSIALALGFLALLVAAAFEARVFSNKFYLREASWPDVRCFPVATLADEQVPVWVTVRNPLDRKATRYVLVEIPQGSVLLVEQDRRKVTLPPNGKTRLTYTLEVEDRVYGFVLMWAGFLQGTLNVPNQVGSCGVLVLPLSFLPGRVVGMGVLALVLLGVTLDLARGVRGARKAMDLALAGAYLVHFFFNWWFVAALLGFMVLVIAVWVLAARVFNIEAIG